MLAGSGINLAVQSFAVCGSMAGSRQLFFGVDAGPADGDEGAWESCGRPGAAIQITSMAVFDGGLYVGTYQDEVEGRVYRWRGGTDWEYAGSPDPCNTVGGMAVFEGELYVGVSHYRASGSSLPLSPNEAPGGTVYKLGADGEWVSTGRLPAQRDESADSEQDFDYVGNLVGWDIDMVDTVQGLTVCGGKLYAFPLYHRGVFSLDASGSGWEYCGDPGVRLFALAAYHGQLFAAGNQGGDPETGELVGGVYAYLGDGEWGPREIQRGVSQVYSFAELNDEFYCGTWPEARVYRRPADGVGDWVDCGRMGEEKEVMGMITCAH